MSRHNRSTNKRVRRTQRSKMLRGLLEAEGRAYQVAMHSFIGEVR